MELRHVPGGWPVDRDAVAGHLRAQRERLAAEIERLTAPPESGATVSFGKRVGDGTTEAVERISTTATARSLAASLGEVDRALAKLDDGTYGTCDGCGAAISPARLEARPAAAVCIECA